jgi:hypothetical protein
MKPCLFPLGCVGIVVNSLAIDSSPACSARTGWQAGAASQADSMLPDPCRVRVHLQAHTATQARGIAPRIPCHAPCYALARRKNPSISSGTLWIGIGIRGQRGNDKKGHISSSRLQSKSLVPPRHRSAPWRTTASCQRRKEAGVKEKPRKPWRFSELVFQGMELTGRVCEQACTTLFLMAGAPVQSSLPPFSATYGNNTDNSCAPRRSTGRNSSSICRVDTRVACAPTFSAACTTPEAPRTGTAIERRPTSSSSSTTA